MKAPGPLRNIGPALRQAQRPAHMLAMTPQLRQAIHLLQLSNLELESFLREQIEANPLLARDGDTIAEPGSGQPDDEAGAPSSGDADEPSPLDLAEIADDPTALLSDDAAQNLWDNGDTATGAAADWSGGAAADETGMARQIAERPSLREHLAQQIALGIADPVDRIIALQLVDLLDEAGYLRGDTTALAGQLGISAARVDAVLALVQGFEPLGVFARTLAECLAIQLREKNHLDPAMQAVLGNLSLLARGDKAKLMKIAGVGADDLDDIIAEIRSLDPRPAHGFDAPTLAPLVPDVIMRPGADGSWHVELNPDTLPRLIVDRRYHATLSRGGGPPETRRFVASRMQEANWLVRTLDQRARTILAVAAAIVEHQSKFFAHGIAHLRPLVLRDIAATIAMHESTVSRATAHKYIATPRGLFELRYFFTAAVGPAHRGEARSAELIRHRIRALVAAESKILSDDAIAGLLGSEGLPVARRTVTKYREAMQIPSSVERRRWRSLGRR